MRTTRTSWRRPRVLPWLAIATFGALTSAAGCQCADEQSGITHVRPEIRVSPAALEFGDVPVGATARLALDVGDEGSVTLHLCVEGTQLDACDAPSHVEPAGAPFSTALAPDADTDVGAWRVAAGETRSLEVRFTPVAQGEVSAKLVLVHDAPAHTTEVTLHGNGVEPHVELSTDVLDFGPTTVGRRRTLDLVLTNGTAFAAPLVIAPITQSSIVFGTEAVGGGDTPAGSTFTGEIPANGALTVHVYYQPLEEVDDANVLHLAWCGSCARDVTVRGSGVKPSFALSPAALDFGTVSVGVPVRRSFTVSNAGRSPLVVSAVSLESGASPDFAPLPREALPHTLAAGESLTVDVDLTAAMVGAELGRLRVETEAWDDPATGSDESVGVVTLSGQASGPLLLVQPATIAFGTVPVGAVSTRNLVLQNVGDAPLSVTAAALAPADASVTLSGVPALPVRLDAGASLRLVVVYHPSAAGALGTAVAIGSSDPLHASVSVPVTGTAGTPTGCALSVIPSQLSFGIVERGRVATMPLQVRNFGPVACHLTNVHTTGAAQFSLPGGAQAATTVAANGTVRIDVAYAPDAYGSHAGALEATTDDPTQAQLSVPLFGASAPDQLRVVPTALDFGVAPLSCSSPTRAVTLYNVGSSAITVSQVFLDPSGSTDFVLDPVTVPLVIAAGGSAALGVHFHPRSSGVETSALFVVHSASSLPEVVPLTGDGEQDAHVTDTFQQSPTQAVDALFVVDSSASMANNQANLGANFASFIAAAVSQQIDYHIAVTTTDVCTGVEADPLLQCTAAGPAGAFVGTPAVLTPQTPNVADVFQQRVAVGTSGSGQERGLEAAYLALSDPLINTTNAGFLRPDAALAIIVVSDDDDSRQDGIPGGPNETLVSTARPVDFYVSFFQNLKGFDSSLFSLNAIIEPHQGDCNGTGQPVEASGYRYGLVAAATGGEIERICGADWGQSLSQIGLNTFGLKRQFALSSSPDAATLAVTVNGASVPAGSAWSYDAPSNSVRFTPGSVPPVQATVTISYQVACLP